MTKLVQLFHPKYRVDECLAEIKEVLESGWTGYGPKSALFEKEFCQFLGAEHGIFLNSATSALHLAVKLLDLPPQTKVATTPITFCSTNHVLLYENLVPVFCDVDSTNLCLSFDSVRKALEKGAKAVLWVHYGGFVSQDFYKLLEYVQGTDIRIIEDCAHASGSFYRNGKRVGSLKNTFSCFSFQAVKNLPSSDSGFLVVPNATMLDRVKKLSWLGIDKSTYARTSSKKGEELYKWRYSIDELGWKYNGNDIVAAVCLAQLRYLDVDNAYRKEIRRWYAENLGNHILIDHDQFSSTHLVVALVANRDRLMAELKLRGYAPGVHYIPNYEFNVFSSFYEKGSCPNTEKIANKILTLPNHLRLTYEDVRTICDIILADYGYV
jgi:dTDP-4-amino-4,6-dideoxygalactose transaminase